MKKLLSFLVVFSLLASPCWAAVDFDGVDDKIASDTPSLPGSWDDGTISIWVRGDDYNSAANQRVMSLGTSNDHNLYFGSNNTLLFYSINGNKITADDVDTHFDDGVVAHILVTWDESNSNNNHIYVNGVNRTSVRLDTATATNDDLIEIGARTDFGTPFGGDIFEVAVWDVQLTTSEIALLVSSKVKRIPLQIQPSNLLLYLPLDDGVDGTDNCFNEVAGFKDLSGNGNHLTGYDGANNTGLTCIAETLLTYP